MGNSGSGKRGGLRRPGAQRLWLSQGRCGQALKVPGNAGDLPGNPSGAPSCRAPPPFPLKITASFAPARPCGASLGLGTGGGNRLNFWGPCGRTSKDLQAQRYRALLPFTLWCFADIAFFFLQIIGFKPFGTIFPTGSDDG